MKISGNLKKMLTNVNNNNLASYTLPVGDKLLDMSPLIGSDVSVVFDGLINCIHCGRKTNKSFNQGYCFPCVKKLARCDTCIIKPELCHYSKGTCREPLWGEKNCLQDHFVYLANTGNIKVGITKFIDQKHSSRWVDQGATQAIPILRVKERLISGLLEQAIAKHIGDKTNWRQMLKGVPEYRNLSDLKSDLLDRTAEDVKQIQNEYGIQSVSELSLQPVQIDYPVIEYPKKIQSVNLDKDLSFTAKILGIKGQYLLLSEERVINIRKYAGYNVNIHFN